MGLLDSMDPDLLKNFLPGGIPLKTDLVKLPVPAAKKVKRSKKKLSDTFQQILREDVQWFNERLPHDARITTGKITVSLQRQLWEWGHSFVIKGMMYQNSEMDMFSMNYDRVNEYEIKSSREDYLRDFDKCVYVGKVMNKHGLLRTGKALANKFWYVCVPGLIDEDHLPEYAGLIYYHDHGPDKRFRFEIIKEAPQLHPNRVSPNFYKTLADRLYGRYYSMVRKYQGNSMLNHLKNFDATKSSDTEHQPADKCANDAE